MGGLGGQGRGFKPSAEVALAGRVVMARLNWGLLWQSLRVVCGEGRFWERGTAARCGGQPDGLPLACRRSPFPSPRKALGDDRH